jgi:isoquinoline 1-oxidoreductase beta subunit
MLFHRMTRTAAASRRAFLKGAAAGGAGPVIGLDLPRLNKVGAQLQAKGRFAPNAFVRIAPDDTVTVVAKHLEMGQGIYTGLATILAEELDADWRQVRVESAPADAKLYNNLGWGPVQGTGGSSGIANSYTQLRKAGATARAMLVQAAARQWSVSESEVTVAKGVVRHATSNRSATFGELAMTAAALRPPAEVRLKEPKDFTLIGAKLPRVDNREKTDGSAVFAMDVKLPGILTALIARPPVFGATVKAFDATAARQVPGVRDVVQVPAGVAVAADGFWPATKGREALKIEWDLAKAETRGTDALMAEYKALARTPGRIARKQGDADTAMTGAAKTLEAAFEFPFLAHAPMEPLDCVAQIKAGRCEVWTGAQIQTIDQANAAAAAGLKPEQVVINTLMAGGGFGRRATPNSDVIVEAVSVAKATGGDAPVKLVWTREDDIRGGRYRPMYFHMLRAALDAQGAIVAWQHRIVGQSILTGTPFQGMVKDGIDATSVEGAGNLPYRIPNLTVDLHTTTAGIPVLWWRSVGSTHTAYATETFIDELAQAAGKDPVVFRRAMLTAHPRHLKVLELAAEKAGWGTPLPKGKGRGVAVHESFNTYVAQVAEVAVDSHGRVKVERVVCAVDCGRAINPDIVRAQMEGGIGFGLGAVLHQQITLKDGKVEQSNFHDFAPLRMEEMPRVEVHIVESAEDPTGVGEPGVPVIGPAVANAVHAATGQRVRTLPFATAKLSVG